MSSTLEDQFKALQGEVDVLAGATLDTPLASLAQWDSLAILLVISYFENIQKVTLSGAQIRACRNAREIFNLKPL